jgi:hypothetical protein
LRFPPCPFAKTITSPKLVAFLQSYAKQAVIITRNFGGKRLVQCDYRPRTPDNPQLTPKNLRKMLGYAIQKNIQKYRLFKAANPHYKRLCYKQYFLKR